MGKKKSLLLRWTKRPRRFSKVGASNQSACYVQSAPDRRVAARRHSGQGRGARHRKSPAHDTLNMERSIREAVQGGSALRFAAPRLRVVMVEMDIYCRSNPLRLDNGTADMLVSEHDTSEEVIVGFWITYPSCTVIDSFRRMYTWVANPKRTNAYCDGAFDQKLMLLRGLGLSAGSHSACHALFKETRCSIHSPMSAWSSSASRSSE